MRKSTFLITTCTCVSIIRAFKYVTLSAFGTLLTVADAGKSPADGSAGVDSNVSIAAFLVGAIATEEMSTRGDTMGGGIMGKIASTVTCRASPVPQELFADSNLVGVVDVSAPVAVGAYACRMSQHGRIKPTNGTAEMGCLEDVRLAKTGKVAVGNIGTRSSKSWT